MSVSFGDNVQDEHVESGLAKIFRNCTGIGDPKTMLSPALGDLLCP
jgi:hypothetical protein